MYSILIDCIFSVSDLQTSLEGETGVPVGSQLLLVLGGVTLEPSHIVCNYGAGTVSLYNKQYRFNVRLYIFYLCRIQTLYFYFQSKLLPQMWRLTLLLPTKVLLLYFKSCMLEFTYLSLSLSLSVDLQLQNILNRCTAHTKTLAALQLKTNAAQVDPAECPLSLVVTLNLL